MVWLCEEYEFDYIVEFDLFYDFFGYVLLLFNLIFVNYLQEYGKGGFKVFKFDGLVYLVCLYWYIIEFGLIQSKEGLCIYGVGIFFLGGEVEYCFFSDQLCCVLFEVECIMCMFYKIDIYQEIYFVIKDFEQFFNDIVLDFILFYVWFKQQEVLLVNILLLGEINFLFNC